MSAPTRPNILLITSDQQHWSLLGRHTPGLQTPHLDRLASQGMLFRRAYCPNPTCTPTRASIITGLHPSQHGAYSLGTRLPETWPTIGGLLQGAGYDAALVGKAHFQPLRGTPEFPSLESYPVLQDLDYWRGFHGPFYGFNHVELARNHTDEAHVGQHYALWMEEKGAKDWRDWFQPTTGKTPAQRHRWNIPADLHYNTWITERSLARLEHVKQHKSPFFLWASYFDPHPSYLVPEPWDRMYDPAAMEIPPQGLDDVAAWPDFMRRTREEKPDFGHWHEPAGNGIHGASSHRFREEDLRRDIAIYFGMMSCLDAAIGRLLEGLDALGLADNTLVVFTSDHGHYFGQHGLTAKGPFHFEDGIKVPMIVRWPGRVAAGAESSALQSLVDYAPTFLDATGAPGRETMSGVSQLGVWTGRTAAARGAVVVDNRHQPTKLYLKTLVTERYKLTVWKGSGEGELYDLESDPGENHNRWADPAFGGIKSALLLQLAEAEMDKEPAWMPRIAVA